MVEYCAHVIRFLEKIWLKIIKIWCLSQTEMMKLDNKDQLCLNGLAEPKQNIKYNLILAYIQLYLIWISPLEERYEVDGQDCWKVKINASVLMSNNKTIKLSLQLTQIKMRTYGKRYEYHDHKILHRFMILCNNIIRIFRILDNNIIWFISVNMFPSK